jgi:plastocyanin
LIAIVVLVGMVGCDHASPSGESTAAALPRYEPGNGVIRGKVSFVGTPPEMETIANQPCHADAGPLVEETVVVAPDGGLKNVFVYVKNGGPKTDGSGAEPATLDQVNCRYVPHVVGVQVGQKLLVRSSDPTLHNVHYNPRYNAAANFGMTGAGQENTVTFATAEFIPVKCDVHPWMTAYIGVFDNPLFARTNDDGTYEITGLKPGKYTLAAWHERYGELTQEIEITDAAATEVGDFEYKEP